MKAQQLLLCCAFAVMLSSTVWAREPVPLNKAGEPIYVRFYSDYVPVGYKDILGFKVGDVAMVRKIYDANYLEVAKPPTSVFGDEPNPTRQLMKEIWIKYPGLQARIRRDKVEVISEESAITSAVSEKLSNLRNKRAVDNTFRELAARETELQERQEQSYPKTLFMGWDKNGNPINGKHTGGGNYFMGWDENGNTINRRASSTGKGNYFMGWDETGNPIIGR